MPRTNPAGPTTVFCDRFWDEREHWWPLGVGVVPRSQRPYWGAVPGPEVTPLVGTPDQWVNGLSYAAWIAGEIPPGPRCVVVPDAVKIVRIRQAQDFGAPLASAAFIGQVQQIAEPYCGCSVPLTANRPTSGEVIPVDPGHEFDASVYVCVPQPRNVDVLRWRVDAGPWSFADTEFVVCADTFFRKFIAVFEISEFECPVVGNSYTLHLESTDSTGEVSSLSVPFSTRWYDEAIVAQAQSMPYGLAPSAPIRQAQRIRAGVVMSANMNQAQTVTATPMPPAFVSQAQDIIA